MNYFLHRKLNNKGKFRASFVFYAVIFFLPWSTVFAQETKLSETVMRIAEELAADDSDPSAVTTYTERLYELTETPVRLNSAGEDEISKLFFLSDFQVKALVDYSHSSGKIFSVYEIANIPGFDKETVEMMIPFIALDNKSRMITDSVRLRHTLLINISDKPGKTDTSSPGSSFKILTRYKFSKAGFSGGLTTEKDPGEKYFTGKPARPDFLSAYLTFNGDGVIRKIIIGDFSARFGEGTNINTGTRTGLSITSQGYMSARNELKQYTSTDENNFFRGVAAEFAVRNFDLSIMYSKNTIDATLGSSSGTTSDIVESLYTSGLHNSTSTLLKKDKVTDNTLGINLSYNLNNLKFGFAFSHDKLSLPVMPARSPESTYDFSGDENSLYSFYYNLLVKRLLFYGELSASESFKKALVQGISFRPSDRLNVSILYRNYEARYYSLHGKGPGAGSTTGNNQGILGNFTFEAARHFFISAGCDIQNFYWLKYRCSSPSTGIRQEARVRFLPDDKLTIEGIFTSRVTMMDDSSTLRIPELKKILKKDIRASVRYTFSERFSIGTRIEYTTVNPSGSKGMLLLQDAVFTFRKIPVTAWFRYCLLKTDDWDSRLYTYENDILYSYSIPALSGEGSRSYVMLKWASKLAEVRVKYGITSIIKREADTNSEEIKFQLKISF